MTHKTLAAMERRLFGRVCRAPWLALVAAGLLTVAAGCNRDESGSAAPAGKSAAGPAGPPEGAIEVKFVYGSEKKAWIDEATAAFNRDGRKIADGRPVFVTAVPMGSGESIDEVVTGHTQAHLVSPASAAFITLGNAKWRTNHSSDLIGPTDNLVVSPVVIAMWKPMAEALGWPGKPVGWKEVLDLARDPNGWATYGHPEWGKFRFGHTHPEYSNSGLIAVLAEAYAGAGKQRGLALDDLQKPEVAKFVGDIERSVVHYGSSTGFFADKMYDGGTSYLSAAVLYESAVVDAYNRPAPTEFPVVAVYPKEGTFWSDHPVGVVQREWATDAHKEACKAYVDYLRAEPQQRAAMKYGFRPGNTAVPLSAPVDAAHGVDPDQPKTTLDVPDAAVVDAAIGLWRKNKKHANVVLVFDTSGSMNEEGKIAAARDGAAELVRMLDDDDTLSLLPFSTTPTWRGQGMVMRQSRDQALRTVSSLIANGDTALYQATSTAQQYLAQNPQPDRISAVVVLTDGADTRGGVTLDRLLAQIMYDGERTNVRVFTIAYGSDARKDVLERVSGATKAKSFVGKPENIRAVFKEIATFF